MPDFPSSTQPDQRIDWVDVAKALGIALVFYGHFVQWFVPLRVWAATHQMKWIYAFHMPVFFLLVGFVYKARDIPFDAFLKRQIRTRLVPAWVFNVVGMLAWITTEVARGAEGWVQQQGWGSLAGLCAAQVLELLYQGRARENWNIVTWFLICLFTVELWQYGLRALVRTTRGLIMSLLCFAALSVVVTVYSDPIHVFFPQRHWWYISTGLTAIFFYQLGMLMRRSGLFIGAGFTLRRLIAAAGCLLITLVTYDLNRIGIVMMIDARFGDVIWFFLTALSGSLFIVFASQLCAGSRVLQYVGRTTLTLMCLNGILLEFVNKPLAKPLMARGLADNTWVFTTVALLFTLLSLTVSLPVSAFLERYVPWTVGRTYRRAAAAVPAGMPPASPA